VCRHDLNIDSVLSVFYTILGSLLAFVVQFDFNMWLLVIYEVLKTVVHNPLNSHCITYFVGQAIFYVASVI